MIALVDETLRRLFTTRVPGITSVSQVRFQPPDEDWRGYVKTLTIGGNPANALNVYLIDLRENRKLRSNAREPSNNGFDATESPAPRRIDCHYLVSSWSPADVTPSIEPTLDEHSLLYSVARVLSENDPLVPDEVFAPAAPPLPLKGEVLPIVLVPSEGFSKLAEFWGTMGDKHRWKPCVYLVITVPITPPTFPSGPLVTTLSADTRVRDVPETAHAVATIGGVVRTGVTAKPVAGAWVELLNTTGARLQLARTDAEGRFRFWEVPHGSYQLRASSATLGPTPLRPIDVPSPTGEYDMVF
jgi:hypothetical protein